MTSQRKRRNRSKYDITAAILEASYTGARKTHIMYNGNLNHNLLKKYLDELVKKGLVEKSTEGGEIYLTSERGRKLLEDYYSYMKFSSKVEETKAILEREQATPPQGRGETPSTPTSLLLILTSDDQDAVKEEELKTLILQAIRFSKWRIEKAVSRRQG